MNPYEKLLNNESFSDERLHGEPLISEPLNNKLILLGLTGGIACYKAAELARTLVKLHAIVQPLMTDAAKQFIAPLTLHTLTGKRVYSDQWRTGDDRSMPHIELEREAQAIVVAPATANFLAKLAHGIADDLLSTLCLARRCPLIVAPAMNRQMWDAPTTQRNVQRILGDGVIVVGPESGAQACNESGMGRLTENDAIVNALNSVFTAQLMAGKRVLITAGPTFEPFDAVRGITNRSSGKMGFALAQAMQESGASVELIAGPTSEFTPFAVNRINVQSAENMAAAVLAKVLDVDIFISVAAVADWRAESVSEQKVKRSNTPLTITLSPNRDILGEVAALPNPPYCVGFAVETDNLNEHLNHKRLNKKVPLFIGNLAQDAIGTDTNTVILCDADGLHALPRLPKLTLARQLVREIAQRIEINKT